MAKHEYDEASERKLDRNALIILSIVASIGVACVLAAIFS